MKKSLIFILVYIFISGTSSAFAQTDSKGPKVNSIKLNDNFYKIVCDDNLEVNTLAFTGDEGVLLVDAGLPGTAEILKSEIKKISNKEVKYLINTHHDGDHTGANNLFSKEAKIIGHKNITKWLTFYLSKEYYPGITIDKEFEINLNGETIKVIPLISGHTNNDIIVNFKKAGIIVVGDLICSDRFPALHLERGGNVDQYIKNLDYFINNFPPKSLFITGHGQDYSIDDIKQYKNILQKNIEIVRNEINAGLSLKAIQEKDVLKDWNSYNMAWGNKNQWISIIYDDTKNKGMYQRISVIVDTLLISFDKEPIGSTITLYHNLRKKYNNDYFQENILNSLGYYLIGHNRIKDAIEILKLNVEEYPESFNVYDSLGEAYMTDGNKELAILNYKKSIELNPQNENGKKMLMKLEK